MKYIYIDIYKTTALQDVQAPVVAAAERQVLAHQMMAPMWSTSTT